MSTLRKSDSTLFGDIRVVILGSAILIFFISLILPLWAGWIVNRMFDLFFTVIHFLGGVLIGVVWIFLKVLNLIGIQFNADAWRVETVGNLKELLSIISNITTGIVNSAFETVSAINPIDDNAPPPPPLTCFNSFSCETAA